VTPDRALRLLRSTPVARLRTVVLGVAAATLVGAAAEPPSARAADPSAYLPREMYTCSDAYTLVQSAPDGYVVGNCKQGVNFRQQSYSPTSPPPLSLSDYWSGGWVYGNFNGCGWIRSENLDANQPVTVGRCPTGSIGYQLNEFAMLTNGSALNADCNLKSYGTPGTSTYGTKCTDGSTVDVVASCQLWANYRPWLPDQDPTDPISGPQSGAPDGRVVSGSKVKWRYVAKYPSASKNAYYVMVRVPTTTSNPVTSGYGNWGFIDADCLALPLPYYTGVPG